MRAPAFGARRHQPDVAGVPSSHGSPEVRLTHASSGGPALPVDRVEPGAAPAAATLYGRLLRLRAVRLRWWVRAIYVEGAVAVGIVLYLADWASAWVLLALPAAVAVAVKLYDLVLVVATGGSPADAPVSPQAEGRPARPAPSGVAPPGGPARLMRRRR